MRIAVAASLYRAISAETTGGTEAFAYTLAEGLLAQGQDVTLFATSDSKTNAKLSSVASSEQVTDIYEGNVEIRTVYQLYQIADIIKRSQEFDILHNNYFGFYLMTSLSPFTERPIVTTMHNHFWQYPNLKSVLSNTIRKDKDLVVFSSKKAQALSENLFPSEVIYHGIDINSFPYSSEHEDYILFLSRIVPMKGIKDAMDAATLGNFTLKVAGSGPRFQDDKDFVEKNVYPFYSEKITPVGTPDEEERRMLYQKAKALLLPTHLQEMFGFVSVEAMASGTPVIAYNNGAIPEVVKDGLTGFIIDPDDEDRPGKGSWVIKKQGIEGLVEAVNRIGEIDRAACRKHVEENFTREKMISKYIDLYSRLLRR